MSNEDTLRPEYSPELIKAGERGKYAKAYRAGTNIVLIDPDLRELFPDSESVNRALRRYAEEHQLLT
jgi:hypothetical protein